MATINHTKYAQPITKVEINWNCIFITHSKKHWDSMFRFCVSLCKDKILSEDLHQTALLKSLKAFKKFILGYNSKVSSPEEIDELLSNPDVQYHFKNWLYRIVKNTYIDNLEISKKWKFESLENLAESLTDSTQNPSDRFPTPSPTSNTNLNLKHEEKDFYRIALDDNWKKSFEKLNDKQRSIIYLASEDYSYKEISSILGIPMGTVMSTLSRALQKLKDSHQALE